MHSSPWGVILAGGEGTRLKALSRFISGDNRPKQFCTLFGSRSLLAKTRGRLTPAISPERVLFVVVKEHERFYLPELADVDKSRIVVQPSNRGTTAAIAYSLLRLIRLDKDPVVAFFPADHHYVDEIQFTLEVNKAFEVVRKHPELLVLLGARAEKAEVEYGWIEPGRHLDGDRAGAGLPAFHVSRFWEKPAPQIAEALLGRGCLWNTFVVAGRARTFLHVIKSAIPNVLSSFRLLAYAGVGEAEAARAAELYEVLPAGDFSRDVLTECPERLAVLRMDDAGWGDLGTPEGVLAAIQRTAPATVSASAAALERETPSSAEACSHAVTSHAFTVWLAGYCEQLDKVRQRTAAKDARAEKAH